jgi:PAS domain-containing protein
MKGRRQLAEKELRESEERYRMLLDGIQDYAVFMMDPRSALEELPNGKIKNFNRR